MTCKRLSIAVFILIAAGASAYSFAKASALTNAREVVRGNAVYAAQLALEDAQKALVSATGEIEAVYRWSCRLRDAEAKTGVGPTQAGLDHVARMRKLHDNVANWDAEASREDAFKAMLHAATYYFEQALAENS